MPMSSQWFTVDELAAYLKMSRTKLYQMAQKGEIPAAKLGTQWRFRREEIDRWMSRSTEGPDYYVHGYSSWEEKRLTDQAATLVDLFHSDSHYGKGEVVLEAGCGVGAQTVTLAAKNPDTRFVSVDACEQSLKQAEQRAWEAGLSNVEFRLADIFNLPFEADSFDHVFLCFVLEHLPNPDEALRRLMTVLKPGGSIVAIEGDHGSTCFHPRNEAADRVIDCLVEMQAQGGGDALIGRRLFPLFTDVGLESVHVSPRMVYVDSSRPRLVEGFTRNTFTAMIRNVRDKALESGLIDAEEFDRGIEGLLRTAEDDGVFYYTFFKAMGVKEAS